MDALPIALAPSDSARVVAEVYTTSLAALVPVAVAGLAALLLRHRSAALRELVWRAAVVALLLLVAGTLLPTVWTAWVLPAALAEPLIALGRLAVGTASVRTAGIEPTAAGPSWTGVLVVGLHTAYWIGVASTLLRIGLGLRWTARARRFARPAPASVRLPANALWREAGGAGAAPVRVSSSVRMPCVVGAVRPVVLLPPDFGSWSAAERRAVLMHEIAHVRGRDVAFRLAAAAAAAFLWFHPAAWLVVRRLCAESEHAADDLAVARGMSPSTYLRALADVANRARGADVSTPSMAFANADGLRGRLSRIASGSSDRRPTSGGARITAYGIAVSLAVTLASTSLRPTHGVLTGLLTDGRWESRAFAVIGLAPRGDSLAVTRRAAASDPSLEVRAWAEYALARRPGMPGIRAAFRSLTQSPN